MPLQNSATKAAIKGGILYFLLVFAAFFVLGAISMRLVAPNFGVLIGLVIELPLIFVWAWIVCGWVVRKFRVPAQPKPRLAMGGIALVLLLLAGALVAVVGLKQSLEHHLADYLNAPTMIGLVAQICFAVMPLLRMKLFLHREAAKQGYAEDAP